MKKLFSLFVLLLILFAAGCKSVKSQETPKQGEGIETPLTPTLKKYPGTMLWEIDGCDKNGQPSTIYLLGTYHAGDDRIMPFPQCVQTAIDSADRFVCELSQSDWNNMQSLMNDLTMQSFLKDLSHTLIDDLTQDEIILITQYIDQQALAQLVCFEPWVLNNFLQQVIILASGLDTAMAYDVMIMQQIEQKHMTFEGLDSAQTQLDLISYGDWDTQLIMLRDTLKDIENLSEAASEMYDLYKVFLEGDELAFEKAYYKDLETEILAHPVYEDYIKALLNDRNEAWANKIEDYLAEGGTTFIFAGNAHFVGPDSVFAYLNIN